jgi:hypothetical protein
VAAATLGSQTPGLASVLSERFGVELDKAMQRSDWSRRPLSEEQIAGLFGTLGLELTVKDLSATQWAAANAPNSYELWFSGKPYRRSASSAG